MGIFSFGKKNKKPVDTVVETVEEEGKKRLFLHISTMGWKSQFIDDDGKQIGPLGSWENKSDEIDSEQRVEDSIKDAVGSLSAQMRKTDQIFILLDGAKISFSDNKPTPLVAHIGLMARKFGEELINCPEVTFGFSEFPLIQGTIHEKRHGLYAFADAQIIRSTLALFDKEGIKVTEIIPKSYMMAQRSFATLDEPYGAIQMAAYSTSVVLINPFLGTIVIRHIPVGVLTLASAVAEKIHMDVSETLKALENGNKMDEVFGPNSSKHDQDTDSSLHQSLQAQAMQPHALLLIQDLNETLKYFTYQRVSGLPAKLEIFGEINRIAGMKNWLEKNLDAQLQAKLVPGPSLLEMFSQAARPMPCNLLKGSDKSLLTIGRNHFQYTENHGFIPLQEFNKQKNIPGTKKPSETKKQDSSSSHRRNRPGKPGAKRGGGRRNQRQKSSNDLTLSSIFAFFGGSDAENENSVTGEEELQQDKQYFAIFALLFFSLIYWGWSEVDMLQSKYNRYASSFIKQRQSLDKLVKDVRKQGSNVQGLASTENLTKILWTEKFLALARLMDNHIWLSNVYLGKEARTVAGANVESTKMVIEGHVLPSTIGHIRKIALYMDKILQDKTGFMSDFRTISFEGASLEGMESDAVINFTFLAWYDQNKRIESLKNSSTGELDASGKKKQPGLADMHNNINKHNQDLAPLIGGRTKR
jgi:hypothetical protein